MATTETQIDGTIESAISSLIEPRKPKAEQPDLEEVEQEEVEEVQDEDQDEDQEDPDHEDEDPEDEEDEEEDTDEDEEDSGPDLYTVKVDGKEVQVTLEDLKRGYSGQQYVQKGMQEASGLRKQAEEVFNALMAERQQLNQVYQQIQSGQIALPPKDPDRSMFNSDPIGYMEAKMKYDDEKAQYDQQAAQMQQLMQQQSYAEQQAQQAYLQRELEALRASVPELADPKTATRIKETMLRLGQEVYGYTADEIGQVMDHRALRVMRDAVKYHELISGKQLAKKTKVVQKSRPVKGGSKKSDSNVRAVADRKNRLRKTGSINDALGLILNA